MKEYYMFIDDEQIGPLTIEEISTKKITKETKIWFEGLDEWKSAKDIDELLPFIKTVPPPINSFANSKAPIPSKLGEKSEFKDEDSTKIFGLKKNVFYIGLGMVALLVGFIYFNNIQEENKAILLEQNRQTETYNQQQKELEEQKARLEEQERIEAERKIQERKNALENRAKELNEEMTILYNNLKEAQENLNNVTGFKFLRTSTERNEQINTAQEKIDIIKERIRIDQEELDKINEALSTE